MTSPRRALYAGSFDPYTNGHHAMVRKAAALFDEVTVLIGVNIAKHRAYDAEAMREAIADAARADGLENVRVVTHDGLVADYCAAHGIYWYVRGLRDPGDYEYEERNARVNQRINPALETIYLRADDAALSSSMVRELCAFGRAADAYVPPAVAALIRGQDVENPQ